MKKQPFIHIDHYSTRRGEFELHDICLSIDRQEIFGILGRSGAGKTVLLEAIAGFFPATKGCIRIRGCDVQKLAIQERGIGFVYQDYGLFPHMTVRDNIAYGMKMRNVPRTIREQKTGDIMAMFSIEHIAKKYPATISGGEAQRTALARALILEPDILLLDEPFSALDYATKRKMVEEVRTISKRFCCTILFVTHDFSEAQHLAHRIGILLDGRMETVVDSADLMTLEHKDAVMAFLGRSDPERR